MRVVGALHTPALERAFPAPALERAFSALGFGWEGYALQSWRLLCSRLLTSVLSGARRSWEGYVLQRSVNVSLSLSPSSPTSSWHRFVLAYVLGIVS